jgi:hypothetical protein
MSWLGLFCSPSYSQDFPPFGEQSDGGPNGQRNGHGRLSCSIRASDYRPPAIRHRQLVPPLLQHRETDFRGSGAAPREPSRGLYSFLIQINAPPPE